MLRGFVFGFALTWAAIAVAEEPQNAAHALAQKFAQQSEPAKTERPSLDYEMEMLRRARAEQPETKVKATAAKPAPAAALEKANAAASLTPAASGSPEPAAKPETRQSSPVVEPQTKTAETAPPPAASKTEIQAKADTKPIVDSTPVNLTGGPATRASLLLALETSGASTKSGPAPTFDPIVCLGDTCFVSAGLEADAVKLSKPDALKLKSTSEASPDSCKGKIACVFRNVAVPQKAQIQVIELGSASRDPLHASDAPLDTSCKMTDGDLACENPIATSEFRIWVVPEEIARSAGVQAIEDAVADGLPHEDVARDTDK